VKTSKFLYVAAGILLLSLGTITSSKAATFGGAKDVIDWNDNANQYDGMHVCPSGAIGALNLSKNDFACRALPTLAAPDKPYTVHAGENEVNGMLTCHNGDYMVGAHGDDTIECQHNSDIKLGPITVDTNGSNYHYKNGDMHGCPQPSGGPVVVVVGIQDSKNQLNCAPVEGPWTVP